MGVLCAQGNNDILKEGSLQCPLCMVLLGAPGDCSDWECTTERIEPDVDAAEADLAVSDVRISIKESHTRRSEREREREREKGSKNVISK